MKRLAALFLLSAFLALPAWGASQRVGAGKPFSTVRAAVTAAAAGDSILVYGGVYHSDHFTSAKTLYFRGYAADGTNSPMPIFDGDSTNSGVDNSKGIFTFTNGSGGTTVDNIEFRNALNSSSNGSGIRIDGGTPGSFVIQNCSIHNCQMEILAAPASLLVQNCLLYASQHSDDGAGCGHTPPCFDHCIYVNTSFCQSFTIQYCRIYHADAGNEVKTRATNSWILYNLIYDDTGQNTSDAGGPSYCIDIPDGGRAYVIGNTIVQSTTSANTAVWSYAAESANNGTLDLYAINNTIVNDQASGGNFIQLRSGTTAKIYNNIMYGPGTHWTTSGVAVNQSTNYFQATQDNTITNFISPGAPNYDYRIQSSTTGSILDQGVSPGLATGGFPLTPTMQYVDPEDSGARPVVGALDIGAFEYQPSSGGTGNLTPILTQPANMTCAEGSTCDQVITATDGNNDPITFSLNTVSPFLGGVSVTTTVPGTGVGVGNVHLAPNFTNAGVYTAVVRALDPGLYVNAGDQKTFTITIQNTDQAVIFNQPGSMICTESSTADQAVASFDPDFDTVTFSKVSGPSFVSISKVSDFQANIHLAPSPGDGNATPYTSVVRASDGVLNTDRSFTSLILGLAIDSVCTPF